MPTEQKVTFWSLLNKSIVVQSILTLGVVGVPLYLYCTGQPVPQELQLMASTVIAFWMGSKVQYSIDETAKAVALNRQAREIQNGDC